MFKKLIAKIRRFFTVAFARRQYNKARKAADEMHAKIGGDFYAVISPFSDKELKILNRSAFRNFKRNYVDGVIRAYTRAGFAISANRISPTTMEDVKKGCFYSTKLYDTNEIEMRRKAFIEWVIDLSEKKKR